MFLTLKQVLKVMLPAGSGSIINNASVSALRGAARMCAYNAIARLPRKIARDKLRHSK